MQASLVLGFGRRSKDLDRTHGEGFAMNRRLLLKSLALTPFVLFGAGCGSSEEAEIWLPTPSNSPGTAENVVLSAEDARDLVLSGEVTVLAAESVKESSPLPLLAGATKVDVDELTTYSEGAGALEDIQGFQARFRAWGVRADRPVLLYDDGEMKFAARVHFLLEYFGGPPAYLVNGGSSALARLFPPDAGSATPSLFEASPGHGPIALVFQDQVFDILGTSVKIFDVRTPAEYDGQLLLPGDARPGHIPEAINMPVELFFDEQRLLYDNGALTRIFERFGARPSDSIVVYCHDGAKSSLAATLLTQCGFGRTSLYYLSYADWSQNPDLPVEL